MEICYTNCRSSQRMCSVAYPSDQCSAQESRSEIKFSLLWSVKLYYSKRQTYSTNAQLVVFLMILQTAPYLCPNDILLGRASTNTPQGPFRETKNPRHRYEFCQRIVDNFWKRWYQDVFPSVVPRRKWHTKCRNVQVDDIVVVADQNARGGKILVYFLGPP